MKLNFAENLRKLRRERGFTQEQLAEKLGVSFQTVSRWETDVVYPDIELLPVIADLFEIRVDEALESAVEIIENISALPEGTILGYHSPTLDRITGRLSTGYTNIGEIYKHFSLYDGEEKLDRGFTAFLANDLNFLEERKGWEWFDSIREEKRYKELNKKYDGGLYKIFPVVYSYGGKDYTRQQLRYGRYFKDLLVERYRKNKQQAV